jgi:hypothetical protein
VHHFHTPRRLLLLLALPCLLALLFWLPAATPQPQARAQAGKLVHVPLLLRGSTQPSAITFWGMNLYVSKNERTGDNRTLLVETAKAAGVQWTREELPWDLIEPDDDAFKTLYDQNLRLAADRGLGIVGMLLTTPPWARDTSCRPRGERYWCPPTSAAEFAEFAAFMAERYDGDGRDDAPGSPRVAAWQIWNEPNDTLLWPDIGADANARKRRYGELLVAAYAAIKAQDPTALVLTGGTYIYDGSCAGGLCDGLNFFNAAGGVFPQVPQAKLAFDIFAIHPYIPTARPDEPGIPNIITIEGRISQTRIWVNRDAGRPDAPIWITEVGWCTAPGVCPGGAAVSEDQQANYLVRALVVAQQLGVQHVSWFQFEDAFNNANREWANAAIVRNFDGAAYAPKPAYFAYQALAARLQGAVPVGTGPAHTHVYNPGANNAGGVYNYRYQRGAQLIDVLWTASGSQQVTLPVAAGRAITLFDRDGGQQALAPSGGGVRLSLSERPIVVVQN